MAETLYSAEGFGDRELRLEDDTRQYRTLFPTLTGNTELVGVAVTGVCDRSQMHDFAQLGVQK